MRIIVQERTLQILRNEYSICCKLPLINFVCNYCKNGLDELSSFRHVQYWTVMLHFYFGINYG